MAAIKWDDKLNMGTILSPGVEALPAPYKTPPSPDSLQPKPETISLARGLVKDLLLSNPSYRTLGANERRNMAHSMVRISAYLAELIRDAWYQADRIGQRPVVKVNQLSKTAATTLRATAGKEFKAGAANQIARVTEQTLRAISFPKFVADLINGTFNAIVNSSIEQMDAFANLLNNVGKTVDQFMNDNITDNQARDWLAQSYPGYIVVRGGLAVPVDGAEDRKQPDWRSQLNVLDEVSLDEDSIEKILVPAARRKLAENRLKTLSTLVMMGMQRIVVTGGKIRATMGFHIDATDRLHKEYASDMDLKTAAAGSVGFGPWSASASMSFSYVRSTRSNSDAELNVDADLTGEVDIRFKTDYMPLQRFAGNDTIERIRANTGNPKANAPSANALGDTPGNGEIGRYRSPYSRRTERKNPLLSPINKNKPPVGGLPDKPTNPKKPTKPNTIHPVKKDKKSADLVKKATTAKKGLKDKNKKTD